MPCQSEKPKMMVVSDPAEIADIFARQGELNVPRILGDPAEGPWFCDADELRLWRSSQNTSAAEPK